ncbi:hypothetical protein CDL15_Pgr001337 [Punica granatum]|uniref:Uncharacterized protein n=1 Tax=Punica granatum TaxID=22663 RepID=A0A218WKW3_PUNGR|nr:hypothetical protein CDL15_Pgr001337 [Punica granatum]PKI77353.1 hypothetical protein CRG98_002298 [Punica granatum]
MGKYAWKTWGRATDYVAASANWHTEVDKGCAPMNLTKKSASASMIAEFHLSLPPPLRTRPNMCQMSLGIWGETCRTEDCDSACALKFPGREGCGFCDVRRWKPMADTLQYVDDCLLRNLPDSHISCQNVHKANNAFETWANATISCSGTRALVCSRDFCPASNLKACSASTSVDFHPFLHLCLKGQIVTDESKHPGCFLQDPRLDLACNSAKGWTWVLLRDLSVRVD